MVQQEHSFEDKLHTFCLDFDRTSFQSWECPGFDQTSFQSWECPGFDHSDQMIQPQLVG